MRRASVDQLELLTRGGMPWSLEQEIKELRIAMLTELAQVFHPSREVAVTELECPECGEQLRVTAVGFRVKLVVEWCYCGWFRDVSQEVLGGC